MARRGMHACSWNKSIIENGSVTLARTARAIGLVLVY